MSQHDYTVVDQSHTNFRADMNLALKALASNNEGATEPSPAYARQWWPDTTTNTLKQRNAANNAWIVRATLAETRTFSRGSNTILGIADYGCFFVATAGFTQTLTAAATLGSGWYCHYRIESGATIVFDPNASENIDGATTKSVVGPSSGIIFCTGSAFLTIAFEVGGADPGAAKAWCFVDRSAGTPVLGDLDYGVASVTDDGVGQTIITFDVAMSDADYIPLTSATNNSGNNNMLPIWHTRATGSVKVVMMTGNAVAIDDANFSIGIFGDQ